MQLYGRFRSLVKDVEATAQVKKLSDRREQLYEKIDHDTFPKWVVLVAGIGFLTDAFDLFAVNAVILILQYTYPNELGSYGAQTGLLCATLVGTIIGQVVFGYLSDRLGRRHVYGIELIVLLVSTVATAMASDGIVQELPNNGSSRSMSILGWLVFWRFVMGLAIGGDYPISAILTSEFAPRKHRTRMLAWVFFGQSLGQALAGVVALIVVRVLQSPLSDCAWNNLKADGDCIYGLVAADSAWRWIIAIGTVPAAIAMAFRLTVPESPRWIYEVQPPEVHVQDVEQMENFFQGAEDETGVDEEEEEETYDSHQQSSTALELNQLHPTHQMATYRFGPEGQRLNGTSPTQPFEEQFRTTRKRPSVSGYAAGDGIPSTHQIPKDIPATLFAYLRQDKTWTLLLGTAGSWFLVDFCYYGLGLHTSTMVDLLWPVNDYSSAYEDFFLHIAKSLALSVAGGMIGSLVLIKLVGNVSTRTIQLWGGACLGVLLVVLGGVVFGTIGDTTSTGQTNSTVSYPGPIILFILCVIAFNLGPNGTTFIIPAELFATRYRGTCYGISAASGKLGSVLAQIIIPGIEGFDIAKQPSAHYNGAAFIVFGAIMLVGAGVTYAFVPDTTNVDGRALTLERLQHGHKIFREIKRQKMAKKQEE